MSFLLSNKILYKTMFYGTFILIFYSCTSLKSTLKTVDDAAIKPPVKNGAFVITELAKEPKYGIDPDYPINIGIIHFNLEESTVGYFFNALESIEGKKLNYRKIDTCCPFPSKHSNMGAGMLSIYEVYVEGEREKINFYFNIYERGKILCPIGYKIKMK